MAKKGNIEVACQPCAEDAADIWQVGLIFSLSLSFVSTAHGLVFVCICCFSFFIIMSPTTDVRNQKKKRNKTPHKDKTKS